MLGCVLHIVSDRCATKPSKTRIYTCNVLLASLCLAVMSSDPDTLAVVVQALATGYVSQLRCVVTRLKSCRFTSQCCLTAACCESVCDRMPRVATDFLIGIYAYDRCLTFSRELDVMLRRRTMSVATGLYMLMHVSMTAYLCSFMSISLIPECRVSTCAHPVNDRISDAYCRGNELALLPPGALLI